MRDPKVLQLIEDLHPKIDLEGDLRKKLQQITHNCSVICGFLSPYIERLEDLPSDIQIGVCDAMKQAVEQRIRCATLLATNRIENLPVSNINMAWEELCTSVSFVCLHLNPEARYQMDAVL